VNGTRRHGVGDQTRPRRVWWSRARYATSLVVLAVVVARVGTGPFVEGLRRTDPVALLAATAITGFTTACCALRWRLVARGLGLHLEPRAAVAAVFRSQFLNATLPGGILGDVDRALGDGRSPRARGARSVVWERLLGQVVQVPLTLALLAVVPSPLRSLGLATVGGLVVLSVVAVLVLRWSGRRPRRSSRFVGKDLAGILSAPGATRGILLASAAAVCGHLAVFVLAAHAAGVPMTSAALLPTVALVLLASGVPLNVAGWGPREGAAAWAFAATGLGAGAGVTTAVVYGVMALVATLPGLVVLLVGGRPSFAPGGPARVIEGAVHG
jgi:glycosyltransferase 2 family protein